MPDRVSSVTCPPRVGRDKLVRGLALALTGIVESMSARQRALTVVSFVSQKIARAEKFRYRAEPSTYSNVTE